MYNSALGVTGQKFQISQMMLPLVDSPILSGSYLKPILTQPPEVFSVLLYDT